MIAEVTDSAGP